MSRVYFHTPSGTAELLGSERAWMGQYVENIASGLVPSATFDQRRLIDLLPSDHYLRTHDADSPFWEQWYSTAWRVGGDVIEWRGQQISTWEMSLNTAMAVGNDATRMLARLHAQCEIHAWITGVDRRWFAKFIDQGLAVGVCRRGAGWESVVELLRSRNDEPVVTSYSVCDSFPNSYISDWQPANDSDEAIDAWYELPKAERWRLSMPALKRQKGGLRMQPDGWDTMRFGHKLSLLDLLAGDWADRFDRALGLTAAVS